MAFNKHKTDIEGLVVIQPDVYGDHRGFFKETYNREAFEAMGLAVAFSQDNVSYSRKGILRGLHFQAPPHAQGKLVTVLEGEVLDVAVDIRRGSPTYGKHVAVRLSGKNHKLFYVPPGFAHGFLVLSETCYFCYKCTHGYYPETEAGLMWNDPQLGIDWPNNEPILSARDQVWPPFEAFESPFQWNGA